LEFFTTFSSTRVGDWALAVNYAVVVFILMA